MAIEAAHTGVTDGNAATQSSTYTPRRMSVRSVGARPSATARSSIDGLRPSMTHRTSFFAGAGGLIAGYRRRIRRPAYFSPARRRLPISSHAGERDGDVAERMQQRHEPGDEQRRRVEVQRQRMLATPRRAGDRGRAR